MVILFLYIIGIIISYLIILNWIYNKWKQDITLADLVITFLISLLSWGFIIVILISLIPWEKVVIKQNNLKK